MIILRDRKKNDQNYAKQRNLISVEQNTNVYNKNHLKYINSEIYIRKSIIEQNHQ